MPDDSLIYIFTAEGFIRSAYLIWDSHSNEPQKFASPFVVNCAFSIELYIKYILHKNGISFKNEKGHNLYYLYRKIPDAIREQVESKYKGKMTIEDFFKNHPTLFIDYRYPFEIKDNPSLNIETFKSIAECFNNYCSENFKEEYSYAD